MTIFNPDGSEVTQIVLPDGSQASEVVAPDGSVVWTAGRDIPDSVVQRPADDNSNTDTRRFGLRFNTTVEWQSIGAEISSNTSGATTAYIYRISDNTLLGQLDISGLSAGDTFTIESVNLQPNTDYSFVLNAGGSNYTVGFNENTTVPITANDGDLTIEAGYNQTEQKDSGGTNCLVRIGDVGFA